MSRIFISHSSRDNAKAAALCAWLDENGYDEYFVDFDPERGLVAGERWEQALKKGVDYCEAVICLISESWLASEFCRLEVRHATWLGKAVIPLLIDDLSNDQLPDWLSNEWPYIHLHELGDCETVKAPVRPDDGELRNVRFPVDGLRRLRRSLALTGLAASSFPWPPKDEPTRAPYRGLRPMGANDGGIFFGRDTQIAAALSHLRQIRTQDRNCLFIILGASGSGKSSLLSAGLLPRIARDDRHFLTLPVIRPEMAATSGSHGLVASLAKAHEGAGLRVARAELSAAVAIGAAEVVQRLRGLLRTRDIADCKRGDDEPRVPATIVLPIDQGEELFAPEARGEAEHLLSILKGAANSDLPFIGIIAIRSDQYARLQNAEVLQGVQQAPFNLAQVPEFAYKDIIEGPAERLPANRVLNIAPELTARLLNELKEAGGADPLPLLAFTLERLYIEYGGTGRLDTEHYDAMGGVAGVIQTAVEAALSAADRAGQAPAGRTASLELLRKAFIPWLCKIDPESHEAVRRIARSDEISEHAIPLIDHLVNSRLIVSDKRDIDGKSTITYEVAHESLLRQWPPLAVWLEEEAETLILLDGVQRASRDWAANKSDVALLVHSGTRLESALTLRTSKDMEKAIDDQTWDYLTACKESELARERDRTRAEERIRYLARIDALTKVPNRMQFEHLLHRAIARAKRNDQTLTLFYIDIDRFREINDTFGHMAGDSTLETVAKRLRSSLPEDCTTGRLAGDVFAAIVDPAAVSTNIRSVAREILVRLADPFYIQGNEVFMTASLSITEYPKDASNVIDMFRNAEAALQRAKQSGGNIVSPYSAKMNVAGYASLMTKSKLKRAMERDELIVHYQPNINLETGAIEGAEALVWWELPERGMILASEFIPIAEETSLIIEIGEWVLNKVCEDFRSWQQSVTSPGRVSVDLSLKLLRQPGFTKRISAILRSFEVSPASLQLEITETTMMEDTERTIKLLDELYALGLNLAVDHFGTGYSSLSALLQFPVSTLKIDESFVYHVASSADDATIVGTIVQMGQNLHMDVVATGVDTKDQLEILQTLGCNYAQGPLFGDPMSSRNYLELLFAPKRNWILNRTG